MTDFNQTLKAKLDKEFPPKVYPCACKFECEKLGGSEFECDNCAYCGTDGIGSEQQKAPHVGEIPVMEGTF